MAATSRKRWDAEDFHWKEIDIAKLVKILKAATAGKTVAVNRVANLLVFDAAGNEIGYVDMLKEEFVRIG